MLIGDVFGWFTDPENWSGTDGVPNRLAEHLVICAVTLLVAILIALPLGLWIGHTNRGGALAINVSNVGRAIPTLALLGLFSLWLGFGSIWPTIIALVALAIPPVITNTYVGVRGVDAAAVDAARGMGYTGGQVLWKVETPLAMPLIMAGVRSSAVAVVATAALAAVVGQGGLGRYITDGLATGRFEELVAGAILVALLALLVDGLFALLSGVLDPTARARRRVAAAQRA
jgi:osmoprotectant transport system permease protein